MTAPSRGGKSLDARSIRVIPFDRCNRKRDCESAGVGHADAGTETPDVIMSRSCHYF
jgi:hypothetical protein